MTDSRRGTRPARGASHRATLLVAVLLGGAVQAAEPERFGTRSFTCKKGEVTFDNAGRRMRYPPGKYETVQVSTPTGILRYTCRYLRGIVTCPMDTIMVRVKRTSYSGRFDVTCYGEPRRRPSLDGPSTGNDSDPAATDGADGGAEADVTHTPGAEPYGR